MRSTWAAGTDGATPTEAGDALLVAGRYRDLGLLGQGGMGEVRRVQDERLGRPAALKLLAWRLVADPAARAAFLEEAAMTARLQHPGVVAVHDQGELPGGRLWYAMAEVRGETVDALLARPEPTEAPALLRRRLVGHLLRACEAVAYAHEQGVVHLDLKPSNLMIGPFGEVLVLDWGLAVDLRRPSHRRPSGTPAYMAPEQARPPGEAPPGPAADVYALGGVLYHILCGAPAWTGSPASILRALRRGEAPVLFGPGAPEVPTELADLCRRALALDPAARPSDAGALAGALRAWLDGARRQAEAEALLSVARAEREGIDAITLQAAERTQAAQAALASLPPFSPSQAREPIWALEDEARALRVDAAVREARWLEQVRGALNLVPGMQEAHQDLADHYHARLIQAEALRSPEAATWEALLRVHDRGRHRAALRDEAPVTLLTAPEGAEVEVWAVVERARRLVLAPTPHRWRTPVHEAPLPLGSYVLRLRAPGCCPVDYPVVLRRGAPWTGCRPGTAAPAPIPLPPLGSLGPDDCLVPAGPAWVGGDPEAPEALPEKQIWVDAFVLRRHPVTHGEYLGFLNDLIARGDGDLAERYAPRGAPDPASPGGEAPLYRWGADGRLALPPGPLSPRHPITRVDWHAAVAWCRWEAARTGLPWRLPDELEWEKAARGVDGRRFAWGDQPELSWANVVGRSAQAPALEAVGGFPLDVSPYGVEGTVGNCRDWCGNVWEPEGPPCPGGILVHVPAAADDPRFRAIRGGAWQSTSPLTRAAARFADLPETALRPIGFRVARVSG